VSDEYLLKEKHSGNMVWYQPPGINRELSHASFSFTGPIRRCHALPIFHSTAKNPHHLIYNAEFRRLFMHFDYFYLWSIRGYIITQVILAFWLVLAYDLLEDRRTIDVIFSKFFPLCFKMAESFENLDNILHDWAKDKVQESLVQALNRYQKNSLVGRRKIKPFLF